MNFCTILLLVVCLLGTYASKTTYKMQPKFSEKARSVGEKCVKDGAPPVFMENLFPWNFPKNELNEKALFCYVTTIGLANQDGIFNPEIVIPIFSSSDKFEEIKKAFSECEGLRGKKPQESTFLVSECFFDKAPIRLYM